MAPVQSLSVFSIAFHKYTIIHPLSGDTHLGCFQLCFVISKETPDILVHVKK